MKLKHISAFKYFMNRLNIEVPKALHRRDYDRYPMGSGSVYIMYYSGWHRVAATGDKAKEFCEKFFGKAPNLNCHSHDTWALRPKLEVS